MFRRLFAVLCLLPGLLYAGTATDRLQDFFEKVHTFRADFKQEVVDPNQNVIQSSSGIMMVSRPGRFRWDYTKPYKQLIIADGKRVWLYDVDLEQVTVKPVDAVLGSAPALLLSGNTPLEKNFEIVDRGERNGLFWVELKPKQNDTGFESMLLGFGEAELEKMELNDSLGNLTRLSFSHSQRNTTIDDVMFMFTPPKGVDVIGEATEPAN
jgi:outer membrane lipoprotein carrier protein